MMDETAAPDGGELTDAAPTEGAETPFDLDSALEEAATNAPDEWREKIGKIQSEVKGLRGKYTPYRDTFDGLAEADREHIFNLVSGLKAGNTEGVAKWMISAAQSLSGDKFTEFMDSLSPKQAAEVQDALDEADAAPEENLSVEELVNRALEKRDKEQAEKARVAEIQANIDRDLTELGLSIERNKDGRLVDFTTQQIAMRAINDHNGDLKAAHEAHTKWLGDLAKEYLQKHQGEPTLAPDGGASTTTPDPEAATMTPAQRAQARINRLQAGPQA